MSFKVQLEIFEGPLDLLLFFIKRDEINIYDIPIAKITGEYFEYLQLMKFLDIKIAGEFILMAATLMRIKAKMLLPIYRDGEEDEEEDPRKELVDMLMEYKKFKEMAEVLSVYELEQKRFFTGGFDLDSYLGEPEYSEYLRDVSLFDLISTFKGVMENLPEETFHEIKRLNVSIDRQSAYILNKFGGRKSYYFSELMKDINKKIVLIVTFIALLELMRQRKISVKQRKFFDDILICKL